jgi:hypothetical protein
VIQIANRIYAEVIPRDLTWIAQTRITEDQPAYLTAERRLDSVRLLTGFQQFFRENADIWLEQFDYREAGPQLILQAFLQRIINGGGRIQREYGLGRRRTDLAIEWPVDEAQGYRGPLQRIVLELKIQKAATPHSTLAEGLPQVVDYARRWGADEAHLLVFNRRPDVSWDEKIWHQEQVHDGVLVQVWGA